MSAVDDPVDPSSTTVEEPPGSSPEPSASAESSESSEGTPGSDHWRRRALKARLFGEEDAVSRIGRFIVLDSLGSGGMGSVMRAYDETLDRQVALKIMHPNVQDKHDGRALREAQALARLSHPNVVQVYEVGEVDDQLFIAMELIHGQTLGDWQAERPPWRRCLDVYIQAGRGLAAAHAAGMVHRDFKPHNCIIDEDGRVRVLDFGLARGSGLALPEEEEVADPVSSTGERRSRPPIASISSSVLEKKLTVTGSVMGTVAYMAPEQLHGSEIDARADQFSFCVSLYEALYGGRPFSDNPVGSLLKMTAGERVMPAAPPAGNQAPRWLLRVLERGMAGQPEERWPSMDALIEALEQPLRRRSLGWAVGVLGVLGGVAWGASLGATPARSGPPPDPCADASQEAAVLWDEQTRRAVNEAMLTTGVGWAGSTWTTVDLELSQYVEQLGGGYDDACRATLERHEENEDQRKLRYTCLEDRGSAVQQVVAELRQADRQVMEGAVQLVLELPDLSPCADTQTLVRESLSKPADLEAAKADREQLRNARNLQVTGKVDQGLAKIAEVIDSATQREDEVLLTEARIVEALLRNDRKDFDGASDLLRDAVTDAIRHGRLRLTMESLSTLTFLVGVEQARTAEGLWYGDMGRRLVDRIEPDGRAKAEILTAVGQVQQHSGKHEQAKAQLEQAIDLLERIHGPDHLTLAEPLNSLGVVVASRQPRAALAHYQRALAIRVKSLGERHPRVILSLINIGTALIRQEQYESAQEYFERALRLIDPADATSLTVAATAHQNLGVLLFEQEQPDLALEHHEQAVVAWAKANGPNHPRVAKARRTLGTVLHSLERYEDAIEQFEQGLRIIEDHNESTPDNDSIAEAIRKNLDKSRAKLSSIAEP